MEFDQDQAPAGTLEATPLPDLLRHLAGAEATGVLRLDGDRELWLDAGRLYFATNPTGPLLVAVLFGADLGAADDIERVLATPSDTSVLDRLLAENPTSEERARRMLREHNLSALFEMLVPSKAAYRFEPGSRHPLGARFAEDTEEQLAEAATRVDIWRRIATRIPSTNAVFTWAESLPDESGERLVSADEWRFLSKLNGTNTVADIINETGEGAFRVCSVLYRLVLDDLIVEHQAVGAD